MKRYSTLYKQFCTINVSLFFAYRANMISRFVAISAWTFLSIITMLLVTAKTQVVAGWTQSQILVITAGLLICLGIFDLNFKKSFQQLPDTIFHGNLDNVLLKPVDSQFMVSFNQFNIISLWRIIIGILFLLYVLQKFHIHVTVMSSFGFSILLLVGVVSYYSIWLIAATLLIWFPRLSNVLDVVNSLNHTSRFPPDMYKEFSTVIFLLLLPYMFIIATPVKVLLQKATYYDILGLVGSALVLLLFSRLFWKFALRSYTSASS